MTKVQALTFNNLAMMSNPVAQSASDSDMAPVFASHLNATQDSSNDFARKQIELQAQDLVRLAKNLNDDSSDIIKKLVNNKLKTFKQMAEMSGVDVNEVISEVMANMSRNDQNKIAKTLKVKVAKKPLSAQLEQQEQELSNPFNTNMFASFGNLTSQSRVYSTGFNTNSVLPELEEVGYNANKAANLASSAANSAGSRSKSYCAKYVSNAIARAGIDCRRGHAYQMADVLASNKNFKEIDTKNMNLSKLPAGCVVVWDKGAAGYSSKYGHIAITLGDGRAASDFVQKRIPQSDRARVYVPV